MQLSRLMIKAPALFFTRAMQLNMPESLKDKYGRQRLKRTKAFWLLKMFLASLIAAVVAEPGVAVWES